ncbi:MAG TPA: DUF6301 family protein [Thermoanaerobaculia bacterium]|nr:DUF6301 family protein [Thermoanaerobaculia bacterium]
MTRAEATETLDRFGWKTEQGKYPRQRVLRYSDTQTVTMFFVDDRLQSIRFELVQFVPQVRVAFDELKATLAAQHGKPSEMRMDGTMLVYREREPNIFVVASTRHDSDFGKKGLGFLAVRYYDSKGESLKEAGIE